METQGNDEDTPATRAMPASDARRAITTLFLAVRALEQDLQRSFEDLDHLEGAERTTHLANLQRRCLDCSDKFDEAGSAVMDL